MHCIWVWPHLSRLIRSIYTTLSVLITRGMPQLVSSTRTRLRTVLYSPHLRWFYNITDNEVSKAN